MQAEPSRGCGEPFRGRGELVGVSRGRGEAPCRGGCCIRAQLDAKSKPIEEPLDKDDLIARMMATLESKRKKQLIAQGLYREETAEEKAARYADIETRLAKGMTEEDRDLRAQLDRIRADITPPKRSKSQTESHRSNRQYLFSNEGEHYLWRESINDLGGIMLGVGSEQNYFMAAWARPEILVITDLNPYISYLHKAYGVSFANAATPEDFIAFWRNESGIERLSANIVDKYGEDAEEILQMVNGHPAIGKGLIGLSLGKLKEKYEKLNVSSFLTDQEQYEYISNLWRRGRVLTILGDLAGRNTLHDLADFARGVEMPIRVFYLSNAMHQITVSMFAVPEALLERFRNNMLDLPFDDESLVLHTIQSSANVPGGWKVRGKNLVRQSLMSKILGGDTQLNTHRQPGKSWIFQTSRGSEFHQWLQKGKEVKEKQKQKEMEREKATAASR